VGRMVCFSTTIIVYDSLHVRLNLIIVISLRSFIQLTELGLIRFKFRTPTPNSELSTLNLPTRAGPYYIE